MEPSSGLSKPSRSCLGAPDPKRPKQKNYVFGPILAGFPISSDGAKKQNPPRPSGLRACRGLGESFFESNPTYPPVPGERDLSPPPPRCPGPRACWRVGMGRSLFWRSYSSQDASKSGQDGSKSAMIASKMPVKSFSDVFSVDDAIWHPF